MVFCAAINCTLNCTNNTKSKVSTFKFSEDPKVREQWLVKMKESFELKQAPTHSCGSFH